MLMCLKQVFRLTVLFTKIKQLIRKINTPKKRYLLVLNVLSQSEQLHKHSALSSTSILSSSTQAAAGIILQQDFRCVTLPVLAERVGVLRVGVRVRPVGG